MSDSTSPTILAIETATCACSVALQVQGRILTRHQVVPRQQTQFVLPWVDELLQEAGIRLTDCDALAYGCGPGSFMGVRTAVAVVQGLAYAAKKPVIGLSTLQALAQAAFLKWQTAKVMVAWDARMTAVYGGCYQLDSQNIMMVKQEDALIEAADFKAWSKSQKGGCWARVGNAWTVYQQHLIDPDPQQVVVPKPLLYPSAQAMLPIAQRAFIEGRLQDPAQARAVYLRPAVAR